MHLRSLIVMLLSSLLAFSVAASEDVTTESSLRVTGTIDIAASGKVIGHTLDAPENLPRGIVDLVARFAPEWTFEPLPSANASPSRSQMALLFVAHRLDDGKVRIELANAYFEDPNPGPQPTLDPAKKRMPLYPLNDLGGASVTGTVYLGLRYDRAGNILDVASEQVNLHVTGPHLEMAAWRKALERSALRAAKQWRLTVPDGCIPEDQSSAVGRIVVTFGLRGDAVPIYGQWETYVRGPRKTLSWMQDSPLSKSAPDVLSPDVFYTASRERRLLTPLSGG